MVVWKFPDPSSSNICHGNLRCIAIHTTTPATKSSAARLQIRKHLSQRCLRPQQNPVRASAGEVATESAAVVATARQACPLHVALERVIATSSGNVVACWQVLY